eukprot:6012470-Pyramimonas_sp.AAC.1
MCCHTTAGVPVLTIKARLRDRLKGDTGNAYRNAVPQWQDRHMASMNKRLRARRCDNFLGTYAVLL